MQTPRVGEFETVVAMHLVGPREPDDETSPILRISLGAAMWSLSIELFEHVSKLASGRY